MAYKISVSPRAQKEIENAIEYYALYSADAPRKLVAALKPYRLYRDIPLDCFFIFLISIMTGIINQYMYLMKL